MLENELKRIKEIEERLSNTTSGIWRATGIPYDCESDENDDPCIVTDDNIYIAQTVYDMQSLTTYHNVNEDTIFIANSKSDIEFLLNFIKSKFTEI